jgi:hypothetical protein
MATVAGPSASTSETTQTACLQAMGILASGRAWLVFLISLAILVQVGLFAAANWGNVLMLRAPTSQISDGQASATEDQPGTAEPNFLQNFWPPQKWASAMKLALPIAGFVALACAAVLILLTVVGIQVNLIGKLPALATMISACYWSIITTALLFPWGMLISDPVGPGADRVPWLFSTYKEIARAIATSSDPGNMQGLVWLRFLVWPVAALLAAWIAGARFGKAYWQVVGLAEMQAKARGEQAHEI